MTTKKVFEHIENWAPKEISWQRDNAGLQVGSSNSELKNIMLCLDVNENVIREAVLKKCNLIISHHPLLFNPVKKLDFHSDKNSKIIRKLIKNDITLYSAHTNLDYTKDGVSFELAKVLKLKNIKFLTNIRSNQYKLIVFVPPDSVEKVAEAIFNAGGGITGKYRNCSFRAKGEGTFFGSPDTDPVRGEKSRFEKVDEVRLEVKVDKWKIDKAIQKMKEVHPYEEVAFDIYPLDNSNDNYGPGAVGELKESMDIKSFLDHISKSLKIKNFRYTAGKKDKIKTVAVCGGSGFEYLHDAIKAGADTYVTADIKYHNFQEAEGKILLIDAGHYETEIHSLNEIENKLNQILENKEIKIFKFNGSTNPIIFYNN